MLKKLIFGQVVAQVANRVLPIRTVQNTKDDFQFV